MLVVLYTNTAFTLTTTDPCQHGMVVVLCWARFRASVYTMIVQPIIGTGLSEPDIDCDNGPRVQNNAIYLSIYVCIIYLSLACQTPPTAKRGGSGKISAYKSCKLSGWDLGKNDLNQSDCSMSFTWPILYASVYAYRDRCFSADALGHSCWLARWLKRLWWLVLKEWD